MSNFFEKSDLSRSQTENIISDTLKKCDDGELYLENSKSESILLDDNKIKNSSYSSDLGFGFRAVSDEVVAYSHSNEISKNSLKKSSENLMSTLKSAKGTYNKSIPKSNNKYYENINPIEQKTLNSKIKILNSVNEYLRSKDNNVKQVTANFNGEQKSIEIIRSGGETLTDVRPLIRFNVSVMLEKNGRKETGVYGIGGRQSYDSRPPMPYTPVSFLPFFSSITDTLNLTKGRISVNVSPPDLIISMDFCSPLKLAVTCLTLLSFDLKYLFTSFKISTLFLSDFCSIGLIFS